MKNLHSACNITPMKSYFTLDRLQSKLFHVWMNMYSRIYSYIHLIPWNVILLPRVDEEIISTSLTPYCCLSIHWWCSMSFCLFFHHYTYWEVKSYIWFGFHGSSWWGVNTARDWYERTSCLRVNGECVQSEWERQTDSVLVGIDG